MPPRAVTCLVAAVAALTAAPRAAAHVVPIPSFVAAGSTSTIELSVPNERRAPMTGFTVVAPPDFRLVAAPSTGGWAGSVAGARASWHGGELAPRIQTTFDLELEAPSAPGPASLETEQHYPDGAVVSWTVHLTVTPPAGTPSQNFGLAVVTGLLGLLGLTALGAFLWRRGSGSLQER
jgi:uncharacterized protein YcnI